MRSHIHPFMCWIQKSWCDCRWKTAWWPWWFLGWPHPITIQKLQVHLHSNLDGSSLAHATQVPMGPLRNLEVLHLFSSHTRPAAAGLFKGSDKWDEGEDEREMEMRWLMMMEMRWQLLNWDTRRGMQKRRGKRENTNTDTPSPERANPERAGKRKSGRTTGQTPTRGGGADRSAWHNLQGESQNLPRHAKDPNLT